LCNSCNHIAERRCGVCRSSGHIQPSDPFGISIDCSDWRDILFVVGVICGLSYAMDEENITDGVGRWVEEKY
jgi:hypothetical protein